jgi:hypothetical protein
LGFSSSLCCKKFAAKPECKIKLKKLQKNSLCVLYYFVFLYSCQKKAWIDDEQMGSSPEEDGQTLLNMDMQYEYKGNPIP